MRFADPPQRTRPEPLLALVNVIFLLLVFVLVVADLAPPDPVAVRPPVAAATAAPTGPVVVVVSPEGVPHLDGAAGAAALAALAVRCAAGCAAPVVLRADAAMPAAALAALLPQLAAAGALRVEIVTVPR
jgi:biopolymer transport protein ExbD